MHGSVVSFGLRFEVNGGGVWMCYIYHRVHVSMKRRAACAVWIGISMVCNRSTLSSDDQKIFPFFADI